MMQRYAGQHIVVLGLGATGLSLARWLSREGASVVVADTRELPPRADSLRASLPDVALRTGPFEDGLFDRADMIAISPGVPKDQGPIELARARGVPIAGDIEFFAKALPRNASVLAITGSNGKTTVTTLVGELCRSGGLDTLVAGNIGMPVLDALTEIETEKLWPDVIVLELSSFQLETTSSLNPRSATVLNVSEDHLDRYRGIDDYAVAKGRIFAGDGIQVLNRDDPRVMALRLPSRRILSFGDERPENECEWGMLAHCGEPWLARGDQPLVALAELALVGRHNAMNSLAALALIDDLSLPRAPVLSALCSFEGLPHRVEPIAEHAGVIYIDDSKGTNVGATYAALEGLGRPVVLIAGGEGKLQDFSLLRPAVDARCRAVVLIGRDAPQIERALAGSSVPREHASSLEQAVRIARDLAHVGDAVLLSPACASFDMFRDYLHRSEVFASAVRGLGEGDSRHA